MRKFLVLTVGLIGLTASTQLAAAKPLTCSNRYTACLNTVDGMIKRGDQTWRSKSQACDKNFAQCLLDGSWDGGEKGFYKKERPATMTAGTAADRGLRSPGATTLGAPVNGGLNAVAPSHTAPATGAALNTQAAIGLVGIDKAATTPSLFSDRFNRTRR
jgi:hypothetical protein